MLHLIDAIRPAVVARWCSLRDELNQMTFLVAPVAIIPSTDGHLLAMLVIDENKAIDAVQIDLVRRAFALE